MESLNLVINSLLDNGESVGFPSADNPVVLTSWKLEQQRMGSWGIEVSFDWAFPLDSLWDGRQYVGFRGERYVLQGRPSSVKSNTSRMYSYTANFVSERDFVLGNVYFYDAVSSHSQGADAYRSNTTRFSFYGTLYEYVTRLGESLAYRELPYTVELQDGIETDAAEVSFEDQTFMQALQKGYEVYGVPFYYDGERIVFGYTDSPLQQVFRYGHDCELKKIGREDSGDLVVTRATGTGSSENIPYYYPNLTPKGDLYAEAGASNTGVVQSDITITDGEKYANRVAVGGVLTYVRGQVSSLRYNVDGQGWQPSIVLPFTVEVSSSQDDEAIVEIEAQVTEPTRITLVAGLSVIQPSESRTYVDYSFKYGTYGNDPFSIGYDSLGFTVMRNGEEVDPGYDRRMEEGDILLIDVRKAGLLHFWFGADFVMAYKRVGENPPGESEDDVPLPDSPGDRPLGDPVGSPIEATCNFTGGLDVVEADSWTTGQDSLGRWIAVTPEEVGLDVQGAPQDGDTITQRQRGYITPSGTLMPPVYRESGGVERFYKALDNTYPKDDGTFYSFGAQFNPLRPVEAIQSFDDIKPTIEGVRNASGQLIGQFLDVAFDLDDRDQTDEDGKYEHPRFFVKLPKMDGPYGFNLFDHAIEGRQMSLVMTSGVCAPCTFDVQVGEDTGMNVVQTDSSGQPVRDADGNVTLIDVEMEGQEAQNDTSGNEVWIALEKDTQTFGVLMPSQSLRPKAGDTFVITGIKLPQGYILAAEERLEKAVLDWMEENSRPKPEYSLSLSDVYLAQNPSVAAALGPDARIQAEYDGRRFLLYVSRYVVEVSAGSPHPKVTLDLAESVALPRGGLQRAIGQVKDSILESISADILGIGTPYFLRKDVPDSARAAITFLKGLRIGRFRSGDGGSGGSIDVDGNGSSVAVFDFLTVRRKAVFKELTVEEMTHAGGQIIVSPASMVCSSVEETKDGYRCFFEATDADGASVYNQFAPDDQARCQTFNMWGNRYYWRLVTAVGKDWIELSRSDCDTASDIPQAGDRIVQLGNRSGPSRQAAQIISCFGENSPSYVMYNGIDSYSLAGKNITGVIFNPDKGEPQMYSYGDFFFGDRDITDPDSTFITFQQREGDTRKKLHIKADVELGPGSSGLDNLEGWGDVQISIEDAMAAAEQAAEAAEAAEGAAQDAMDTIAALTQDGVITPLEKQALKNELARIQADYRDVQAGYQKYGLGNPTDYNVAYTDYLSELQDLTASSPENIPVPPDFDAKQQAYYDEWTKALDAVAAAAKKVADDAAQNASLALDQIADIQSDMQALQGDISGLQGDINDLDEYMDGVFRDGVVDDAEAIAIGKYLNTLRVRRRPTFATPTTPFPAGITAL